VRLRSLDAACAGDEQKKPADQALSGTKKPTQEKRVKVPPNWLARRQTAFLKLGRTNSSRSILYGGAGVRSRGQSRGGVCGGRSTA
jgi:hypothetical protein